jgi:hypothetical protein
VTAGALDKLKQTLGPTPRLRSQSATCMVAIPLALDA